MCGPYFEDNSGVGATIETSSVATKVKRQIKKVAKKVIGRVKKVAPRKSKKSI